MLTLKFSSRCYQKVLFPVCFNSAALRMPRKLINVSNFADFRKVVIPNKTNNNSTEFQQFLEYTVNILRRKLILIRGFMVKLRCLNIPLTDGKPIPILYSFSNLAGHGSFFFLALSYLETDFLNLRLYAASGIFLSIIFQYYREIPLWIPIRWNTLFLAINSVMILFLLKDAADARFILGDEKKLYVNVFEKLGMSAVDFLHLMNKASRQSFNKGDILITQGKYNDHLYMVVKGRLSVSRDHKFDYHINQHQFVGEMSFLTWKDHLHSSDLSDKNVHKELSLVNDISEAKGDVDTDETYGVRGSADVICDEDCVVYGWRFSDLKQMLIKEPSMAAVFERCLSDDLFLKMRAKWSQEPFTRYKLVLSTALLSGEVSPKERTQLSLFRREHGLSDADHWKLTKELGWTEHDFEVGYKNGPSASVLSQYREMLAKELKTGKVTLEAKNRLRQYRQSHGIRHRTHSEALELVPVPNQFATSGGWTSDMYEAGELLNQVTVTKTPPRETTTESRHYSNALPPPPTSMAGSLPVPAPTINNSTSSSTSSSSSSKKSEDTKGLGFWVWKSLGQNLQQDHDDSLGVLGVLDRLKRDQQERHSNS